MFQVSTYVQVNRDMVEAIIPNNSKPAKDIIREAMARDACFRAYSGVRQDKTLIRMSDGFLYIGPLESATCFKRLGAVCFKTPSKAYIRKEFVREIARVPDKGRLPKSYITRIAKAKNENKFLSLCGKNSAKAYVFMRSGFVYSVTGFSEEAIPKEKPGKEEES